MTDALGNNQVRKKKFKSVFFQQQDKYLSVIHWLPNNKGSKIIHLKKRMR